MTLSKTTRVVLPPQSPDEPGVGVNTARLGEVMIGIGSISGIEHSSHRLKDGRYKYSGPRFHIDLKQIEPDYHASPDRAVWKVLHRHVIGTLTKSEWDLWGMAEIKLNDVYVFKFHPGQGRVRRRNDPPGLHPPHGVPLAVQVRG